MLSRRDYAYGAMAVASAALIATIWNTYWVFHVVLLFLLAFAVAIDGLERVETGGRGVDEPQLVRSRVAHYVLLETIKDSRRVVNVASNPFETAVLEDHAWRELTRDQLWELHTKVAAGNDKTAPSG